MEKMSGRKECPNGCRCDQGFADICAEFCREAKPWIRVYAPKPMDPDIAQCIVVQYREEELKLNQEIINWKKELINSAAAEAIFCSVKPHNSYRPIFFDIFKGYGQTSDYCIRDALQEIVELLEASCPENENYDPDYIRKMMV